MIALKTALLSAALSLQPYQPDEDPVRYRDRVAIIVDAIGEEARSRTEAFAVLVIWHSESRFDRRIHAGIPHPVWHEDHGRARCGLQVHQSNLVPRAEWWMLTGTDQDSTRRCAAAELRVFRAMSRLCAARGKRSLAASIAGYGSGQSCEPTKSARERAGTVHRLMSRFY